MYATKCFKWVSKMSVQMMGRNELQVTAFTLWLLLYIGWIFITLFTFMLLVSILCVFLYVWRQLYYTFGVCCHMNANICTCVYSIYLYVEFFFMFYMFAPLCHLLLILSLCVCVHKCFVLNVHICIHWVYWDTFENICEYDCNMQCLIFKRKV